MPYVLSLSQNYCRCRFLLYEWHCVIRRLFPLICFFQAEDGIRDLVRSRGLGDVYKRQVGSHPRREEMRIGELMDMPGREACDDTVPQFQALSLIHI